jgi:cysteinyl-tRNA synthetase
MIENEIAQSCCAFGTERMANVWMHNGFLQVEGQKMSKSLGNFITIRDVLNEGLPQLGEWDDNAARDRWVGLAARLSMLQTHYREPINWTAQRLAESSDELRRWYGLLRDAKFVVPEKLSAIGEVTEALSDDLNSWVAITALRKAFKNKDVATLGEGMALMGLLDPYFVTAEDVPVFARANVDTNAIEARIAERLRFIKEKNFAEADRIRDALLAEGVQLKDGKDPATGERMTTWDVVG